MKITVKQLKEIISEEVSKALDEATKCKACGADKGSCECDMNEVTPPGYEKIVKALKRGGKVKSPWAIAWSMKKKGIEPQNEVSVDDELEEVTPPGGEKIVKALKKQKGVKSPWAVAWAMKKKGQI